MSNLNFEQARFNMVEQQVRTWDVLDPRALKVLHETPREQFVPENYQDLAYADTNLPLNDNYSMIKPVLQARFLQELGVQENETVLEIGTGTGYLTAMLAQLAQHVISVDQDKELLDQAKANLAGQQITNVTLEQGDASNGWDKQAPYDAIICTASFPTEVPESFLKSIKVGGRMLAIIGESPVMEAVLITRNGENEWSQESLFETDLAPISGIVKQVNFTL